MRLRGAGGLRGAGMAFPHRAAQTRRAHARTVHLRCVAAAGRGRRAGAAAAWAPLRPWLGRARFVCFWGTVYFAAELIAINLLKLVWARTRFDDMLAAGDFSRFTSWLQPLGRAAPAFRPATRPPACGIFMLLIVCDVSARFARRRGLVWVVCWAYVAGMALSRMVMGRHFLSDTVMAAGVMAVLFLALTHTGAYRKSLAATPGLCGHPARQCALILLCKIPLLQKAAHGGCPCAAFTG